MADSAGKRAVVATQPVEATISTSPRKRKRWDEEEEQALTKGVEEYGEGHWRHILNDEEYGQILRNRDNVQLKDKWRNIKEKSGIKPEMAKVARTTAASASAPVPANVDSADAGIPDDPRPLEILRSKLPQILCELHSINSALRDCANILPLQRTLNRSGTLEKSLKNACELAGIDVGVVGRAKKKQRKRPSAESPGGIRFQMRPFRPQEMAANTSESESDDEAEGKKETGEDTSEKKKSSVPAQAKSNIEAEEEDFSPLQTRSQRRAAKQQPLTEGSFSKILRSLGIR